MQKHFFTLLLLLSTALSFAQSDWELKKDQEGIKVWWRAAENSDIKEIKMTFTVEASLNSVAVLMSDVENFENRIYATTHASVTKTLSPNDVIYYNVIDFPWPLDDRDLYLRTTLEQDPQTKVITSVSRAVPDIRPSTDTCVRIETADIKWVITPVSSNRATVEYHLLSDPGGSLPAFLVNIASDYGPFKSIQMFKEQLQLPEYSTADYPGVEELLLSEKK